MKRMMILLAAAAMIAALSVTVAAEYVACLPGEEHSMSDWKKISENDDGSSVYERICSKCDYHQKGIAGSDPANGVATTRGAEPPENLAVTTSLPLGEGDLIPVANPSTGARA